MDRTRVIAIVLGAFAVVLFAAVATAEPVTVAERAPRLPFSLPELGEPERTTATTVPVSIVDSDEREPSSEPAEWVTLVIELALMCMLLAALGVIAKRVWGNRPATRSGEPAGLTPLETLVEVSHAIVDDADEQLTILRSGRPRNAIVECWLRLEMLVESSGLESHPADTSTEFVHRVLGQFDVDDDAVASLSTLYREARFSEHRMDERHREDAIAALGAIHASLRERQDVHA